MRNDDTRTIEEQNRQEEAVFVREFLALSDRHSLPWRLAENDPPDVEIGADFSIGMEITRVSNHEEMQYKANWEALQDALLKELYVRGFGGVVSIGHDPKEMMKNSRSGLLREAQKICDAIMQPSPIPNFSHSPWIRELRVTPGCCAPRIMISRSSGTLPPLMIEKRIVDKEQKRAKWADQYDEQWLLLVAGCGLHEPRAHEVERALRSGELSLPEHAFDRIFFLQRIQVTGAEEFVPRVVEL